MVNTPPVLFTTPWKAMGVMALHLVAVHLMSGLSLTERSPFIPEGFNADRADNSSAASSMANQPLEFRGMYSLNGRHYFLVSTQNGEGKWMSMGESDEGVTIEEWEGADNRLLVNHNGNPIWLDMSEMASLTGKAPVATPNRTVARSTSNNRSTSRAGSSSSTTRRTIIRPSSRSSSGSSVRSSTTTRRPRFPTRSASRYPKLKLPEPPPNAPPPAPSVPMHQPPDFIPGEPPPDDSAGSPFD